MNPAKNEAFTFYQEDNANKKFDEIAGSGIIAGSQADRDFLAGLDSSLGAAIGVEINEWPKGVDATSRDFHSGILAGIILTFGAGEAAELGEVGQGTEAVKNSTLEPGPYAGESIAARGPERDFTLEERAEMNRIGRCHTCGTTEPGTKSGDFIPDHQPPSKLNPKEEPQRLYPQCASCSRRQGGEVNGAYVGGRRKIRHS